MPRAKAQGLNIKVGDTVVHQSKKLMSHRGRVTELLGNPTVWVRVKTGDGKHRIWARENLWIWDEQNQRYIFGDLKR